MPLSKSVHWVISSCVLFLLGYTFYYQLGGYALLNNNEGLYAQIPLEMIESGNFVIPTLNGNPYIEKPPLLYWLIAGVYKLFGVSEWTSRFVTATAGFLLCLIGGTFLRLHKFSEGRWLYPLLLGTSIGVIIFSRIVYFDVLLTFFFSLSLYSFYTWYDRGSKSWLYLSYTSLALAILAKGFLAFVLASLIVGTFLMLDRARFKKVLSFLNPGAIFLFLLIVVPWHKLSMSQEKGFAWFYFINEHILRFLDLREPRDYYHGSFYYYLPRIAGYIFPWTLFLSVLFRSSTPHEPPKLTKFLWIWFLLVLGFFSFSQAKANYYIVLGLPPLVMLIAIKLESLLSTPKSLWILISVTVTILLLTGLGVIVYFYDITSQIRAYKETLPWMILLYTAVYGLSGLVLAWFFRKQAFIGIFLLGTLMVPVFFVALQEVKKQEDHISVKNLVLDIPASIRQTRKHVYLYRDYEALSSTLYYMRRSVPIVESHSRDLLYGQNNPHQPDSFLNMNTFERILKEQIPVYVISRDKYQKELEEKGLRVLSKRAGHVLMEHS